MHAYSLIIATQFFFFFCLLKFFWSWSQLQNYFNSEIFIIYGTRNKSLSFQRYFYSCEAVPLLWIPIAFSSFDVRSFKFSTSSSVLYPSAWKSSVYSSSSNPSSHASTLCCGRRTGCVRPNSVQILFHLSHLRAQFDWLVYAWNTATEWGWQEMRCVIMLYTVDFQSHWYCNTLILGRTFSSQVPI